MSLTLCTTDIPAAVAEYARLGWAIFACQPRGKTPITARGALDATNDIKRINGWWGKVPNCNIGVATGAPSGFFVLDVDGDDGEASLRALENKHGALPATIEALTGKGRHCYFRIGEHGAIKNSVGKIAAGLDIRGDGGYVLAPPSVHPTGRIYTWSVDSADNFADAPEWLHELIRGNRVADGPKGKPIEHWHRVLTSRVCNGERNTILTSVCGKLFHSGLNDLTLLYDVMLCVNEARCEEALPEAEVETIVESVVRSHLRRLQCAT